MDDEEIDLLNELCDILGEDIDLPYEIWDILYDNNKSSGDEDCLGEM